MGLSRLFLALLLLRTIFHPLTSTLLSDYIFLLFLAVFGVELCLSPLLQVPHRSTFSWMKSFQPLTRGWIIVLYHHPERLIPQHTSGKAAFTFLLGPLGTQNPKGSMLSSSPSKSPIPCHHQSLDQALLPLLWHWGHCYLACEWCYTHTHPSCTMS